MSRTNDIVFIFSGGKPFTDIFPVEDEFDHHLWSDSEQKLNYRRRILKQSRGAGPDVNANVGDLMRMINNFTGSHLDTIGQVCILGRSAGAGLALGLAAELNSQGVGPLTYVGLSDLPMYDLGWDPAINKVGNLSPTNGPTDAGMHRTIIGATPLNPSDPSSNSIPQAKLSQDIKANFRVNIYQIQGNHTKYSSKLKRWIWHADSSIDHEVHGKVEGWDNQRFDVKGKILFPNDLDYHIDLNTNQHWKNMCSDAAKKFANLPPQPLP